MSKNGLNSYRYNIQDISIKDGYKTRTVLVNNKSAYLLHNQCLQAELVHKNVDI